MIERTTKIGELLEKAPEKANILLEAGMHCLGCPASQNETLEEACDVHGIDVEEILAKPRHKAPKLIVDTSITNFYDFTVDSFQLVDYEYEKLDKKIPVAI
jgi:hybrid cluster-associated redox disulfide protein